MRFVQLLTGDARADAQSALFTTALRALQVRPRIQATFEAPPGDPARVLVSRSRAAIALVVGADSAQLDDPDGVAAYCQAHAACTVNVVTTDVARALGP